MGTEFRADESDLRDNYLQLSKTTGESLDSIADRLETNAGDHNTAAKLRALAAGEVKTARKAAPRKRTAPSKSTAASTGGKDAAPVTPAKKATPAKAAPAKPAKD